MSPKKLSKVAVGDFVGTSRRVPDIGSGERVEAPAVRDDEDEADAL